MNRRDFIAVAVVLALSALLFLFFNRTGESGSEVVVTKDGEVCGIYSLYEDRRITLGDDENVIVIEDCGVRMESADCPDEYCVKQGTVSRAGESIICLPNRVVVEVKGGEGVDAVSK